MADARVPSRGPHPAPASTVPFPVRVAAEWGWRFLVLVAATAVAAWLISTLRLVVFPLVVALLLAALLDPAVRRLRAVGLPRGVAAPLVFVTGIAGITMIFVVLGDVLAGGIGDIGENVEGGLTRVRDWLTTGPLKLSEDQLTEYADSVAKAIEENRDKLTTGAIHTATLAFEFAAGALLALFAAFFFILDGRGIWNWVVRLFPRGAEPKVAAAGEQAWITLGSYVRGTVLVAFADGSLTTIWLLIIGVPLAVPLGALVFFGAFVPLVGGVLAGAVAILVALVANGLVPALLVAAGVIAVFQIEGHVLQPLVLGRLIRIHPLAVVLAVTAGALVAGIAGALVAVPLVAVINTVTAFLVRGDTRPHPVAR